MTNYPLDKLIAFLPQKPPSLYLDHVMALESGVSVRGAVTFPSGHRVFENHLPGEPLVPGVVLIEALAQLAGIVLMDPGGAPVRGYIAEVGQTRFYRLVRPGEEVLLDAELDQAFSRYARFRVEAHVDGELTLRGSITLASKDDADAPST